MVSKPREDLKDQFEKFFDAAKLAYEHLDAVATSKGQSKSRTVRARSRMIEHKFEKEIEFRC